MIQAKIASITCGDGQPLTVLAGPCVIETEDLTRSIAAQLKEICLRLGVSFIFKASFDKANRSSSSSYRGVKIEDGLRILSEIRRDFQILVVTDIHEPYQAALAAQSVDLLQIPAFLSRQTSLLQAAAETGKPVNVKKGQFMSPAEMKNVVDKLKSFGCENILLCERGTFFGYNRLVNDMTALPLMRALGVPVVFDATHSVQNPGSLDGCTGGNRKMVAPLARAAAAVGIDALFFETHPNPEIALCDGPNSLYLNSVESFLKSVIAVREAVKNLS